MAFNFNRAYNFMGHYARVSLIKEEYEPTPDDVDRASRIDLGLIPNVPFSKKSLVGNMDVCMLIIMKEGKQTVKQLQQAIIAYRQRADEVGPYTYMDWIRKNPHLEIDKHDTATLSLYGRHVVYELLKKLEVASMLMPKKRTRVKKRGKK